MIIFYITEDIIKIFSGKDDKINNNVAKFTLTCFFVQMDLSLRLEVFGDPYECKRNL